MFPLVFKALNRKGENNKEMYWTFLNFNGKNNSFHGKNKLQNKTEELSGYISKLSSKDKHFYFKPWQSGLKEEIMLQ